MTQVVVIGAGLAGLSCALSLEIAGLSVSLLEGSDAPGGRVRTDMVEGFRLDRGFQVMLTAYPEAKRLLDYEALQLKKFEPGALVWHSGKFHRFADPFRNPMGAARLLFDSIVPLKDKLQVAKLRARVQRGTFEEIFARTEKTTREYLQAVPLSPTIIERFFEPFFAGVFLERDLVTSSRFFEFLFRMFSAGDTAVPAGGMQQIPLQLAAKLRAGTLLTGARVSKVTRSTRSFQVEIEGREKQEARAVVLAVAGNDGNRLLGGVGGWSIPEVRAWNKTTAFCYAAQEAPVNEPILLLNGEGRAAGPVNHVAVMSAVSARVCAAWSASGSCQCGGGNAGKGRGAAAPGPGSPAAYGEVVWPRGVFMEDAWGLHSGACAAPAVSRRVGASSGAGGGDGRRLYVWRLPRNGLDPGRVGLREACRGSSD